ncbi:MAG: DNA gyrase inhibitor YacG [Burkholderiaceae bacterium]
MAAKVPCPTCGKQVEWNEKNASRPFCSERCKSIDLGAWAAEQYRVAGGPVEQSEELPPSESGNKSQH